MRHLIAAFVLAALISVPAAPFAADNVKVVGNPGSTPDSVTQRDISRIFLKQRSTWSNGQSAEPVDQERSTAARSAFLQEILGKTAAQVESHWQGMVFSGRATPPPTLRSDAEVLDFVRTTRGAVGYISADTPATGVKVISIVN